MKGFLARFAGWQAAFSRKVFRVIGVLAFISAFAAVGQAAEPPGTKGYMENYGQFILMVRAAQNGGGELPRMGDAKAGPLLRQLSDVDAVFGTQRYGKDDVISLINICGLSNSITVAYMTTGTQEARDALKRQSSNLVQTMQAWEDSARAYQDEAIPVMAFSTVCMGKAIPALEEFWKTLKPEQINDVRRQGIKQLQLGVNQLVTGSLVVGADKSYSIANRALLLRAIAENIDFIIGAVPLADRRLVQQNIELLRKDTSPELAKSIASIARSLSRTDCDDLCKLQ